MKQKEAKATRFAVDDYNLAGHAWEFGYQEETEVRFSFSFYALLAILAHTIVTV